MRIERQRVRIWGRWWQIMFVDQNINYVGLILEHRGQLRSINLGPEWGWDGIFNPRGLDS